MCLATAETDLDAGVPSKGLGVNRWADVDGDDELDLGKGHEFHGCSISAMEDWTAIISGQ